MVSLSTTFTSMAASGPFWISVIAAGVTRWVKTWKLNSWRLKSGGPVTNREDFEKLDLLNSEVDVVWVSTCSHLDTLKTGAPHLACLSDAYSWPCRLPWQRAGWQAVTGRSCKAESAWRRQLKKKMESRGRFPLGWSWKWRSLCLRHLFFTFFVVLNKDLILSFFHEVCVCTAGRTQLVF